MNREEIMQNIQVVFPRPFFITIYLIFLKDTSELVGYINKRKMNYFFTWKQCMNMSGEKQNFQVTFRFHIILLCSIRKYRTRSFLLKL